MNLAREMSWTYASLLMAALLWALPAQAEHVCGAAWDWKTVSFHGIAFGQNGFTAQAGPHVFALVPIDYGWRIHLRDGSGKDLPVFSPPVRPVGTDGLNIAGWHFRNRANTGPNQSDVNVPQTLRKFTFGRYATDPQSNPELIAPTVMPSEGDYGAGEVIVEDFGLTDLEPGKRARMVYLKFRGCVEWNPGHRETNLAQTAAPRMAAEPVIKSMEACGLDADLYRLSDRMSGGREGGQRPWLEPDLDDDGVRDMVVPVIRLTDQALGLALCLRKGKKLLLAGFNGRIGNHLDPDYFGQADWWNVYEKGTIEKGMVGAPPDQLKGDAIHLGIEGASSVLLFLTPWTTLSSYWQGD